MQRTGTSAACPDSKESKPTKASRHPGLAAALALAVAVLATSISGRADTLYVSTYSSTILKFASDGSGSLFYSGGLQGPMGLAFDGAGNLYVADRYTYEISKITPDGTRSVFANTGLSQETWGLAFDGAVNLYSANHGNNTVTKYAPDGSASVFASTGLSRPSALAFDQAGNLYVANEGTGSGYIEKFTADGAPVLFASTGSRSPVGLAFDSAGRLYATSYYDDTLLQFTPEGAGTVFAHTGYEPMGLAFDRAGNLYVADAGAHTIETFAPDGTHSVFANSGSYLEFIAIIPEPPTCALLALGIPALLVFRSLRQHNA